MSELLEIFESNARAAAAVVERIPRSPQAVSAAVQKVSAGARSIVIGPQEVLPPEILLAARALPGVIANPSDEQLATADAGVTEAFAAVASSGSVCIAMGPALSAAASLLMPLHVVLLGRERIVPRPRDLFQPAGIGREALRRNLVFITGPSATADMGPLVRGVHGPHRLHILILE
jgi:L-lactate dehydrogenase complex protein LldG